MRESESDRRARRGFRRWFVIIFVPLAALLLVVGKAALPAETSVTSNAPVTTRTLDPRVFPSTTTTAGRTVATTSMPTVVATAGELIVIDGDHVYRLPRTQAVALYLWLALQNGK